MMIRTSNKLKKKKRMKQDIKCNKLGKVLSFGKDEGLPGVLGNKGTLVKYRIEQENMSLLSGNR